MAGGVSERIRVMLLGGFVLFAIASAYFHITGVDVGFHIRTGQQVLASGRIPETNGLALTQSEAPWLCQQWWPGVWLAVVFRQFGLPGLIATRALLVVLMFGLTLLPPPRGVVTRQRRMALVAALIAATAGICLARVRFFVRPFMISGVCFALVMAVDRRFPRSWRWHLLGLPLLMAIWANTHAGVMYGFVYLGLQGLVAGGTVVAARLRNRARCDYGLLGQRAAGGLLGLGAALLSVELINPSGYKVILLPLIYFADPFWHALIYEFRPMTWAQDMPYFISLAVLALLQLITRKAWRGDLATPAGGFALLALRSQRCLLFFALAAVPYAAWMLSVVFARWKGRFRRLPAAGLAIAWCAIGLLVFVPDPKRPLGIGLQERLHPVGIYAFMQREVPPQPLFNSMAYGAGILWWLYPDFKPFIDGRCEAYPKWFWRDVYLPLSSGTTNWALPFQKYGVTAALLNVSPSVPRLAGELDDDPEWALVTFDDYARLYLKRTAANAGVIAAHASEVLAPDRVSAPHNRAQAARLAVEARRLLAISPGCRHAQLALAAACFKMERWQEAADAFQAFLSQPGIAPGERVLKDYDYARARAATGRDAGEAGG